MNKKIFIYLYLLLWLDFYFQSKFRPVTIEKNISYKKIKFIFLFLLIGMGFGILITFNVILSWEINCENPNEQFVIPKGASVTQVSDSLYAKSCDFNNSVFKAGLYLMNKTKAIFPGKYQLKGIRNVGDLIKLITAPSGEKIKVTIIEGWELYRIIEEIDSKMNIDAYKFEQLCKDHNFMSTLNIPAPSLEGFLFPDTYYFLSSSLEEDIIQIMVNQFFHHYDKSLQYFAKRRDMSMLEVVTMASIIQGEAMYIKEMKKISSVYHNRIKKGMLLQADPTVQYAIPGKNIKLYYKHLKIDNPYNTYKYKGLPPGPINSPGLEALKAAVTPLTTDYLFFVANGTGLHTFTKTIKEHNKAKNEIKRKRKKNS